MPTLPASSSFTGSAVTEAQFKSAITDQREFLAGLLGTAGTQAAALTAVGAALNAVATKTAAYTVVSGDRGKLIDYTTAGFTLTLTAAATLGAGFVVAVRNSASSGVVTIDPNSTETIDGAATVTLAAGESCLIVCDGTGWKTVGKSVTPAAVPVRQTVLGGPCDSSGYPSFLPATSGSLSITSQNITTGSPFVAAAANGFGSAGAVDRVGQSTANITWSGLTANSTNYLYVDVAANGTLTAGSTTLAPTYQFGGTRSTTSGEATYNTQEMSMTVGNGSTSVQTYRVFVGEVVTNASTVTSTAAYAYQGRYDSGWFAITTYTTYTKSHNLGYSLASLNADAWFNTAPDGSGYGGISNLFAYNGSTYNGGLCALSRSSVSMRTGSSGVYYLDTSGTQRVAAYGRFTVNRGW